MRATIWLAVLGLGVICTPTTRAFGAPTLEWEPYSYTTREGDTVSDCERAWLVVPESRTHDSGRTLELHLIRFRSTAANPGAPIVWLAGGPSDFGSDDIEGPYLEVVRAFQAVGDVIALDQRGAGLSQPRLDCPESVIRLPLDEPLDPERLLAAYREVAKSCADSWTRQGVDLAAYNTEENADDLESLRLALGAPRIRLYGGSYGTHLGLSAIRRHPDGIDRAVLSGVEGPDHSWKLPSVIETHFTEVARAHGSSGGELLDVMRRVLVRLDANPVTVDLEGEDGDTTRIVVGGFDMRMANRYFLGDLDNIRQLPEIYAALDAGDYSALGQVALAMRSVRVGSAMYYCMDCASGSSPERARRIQAESSLTLSLVGSALNVPFPSICESWPVRDLGEAFRGPLQSPVPVLFISGTLDGQTPVSNVAELLPGFPNGAQLIVENASHQYLELADPQVIEAMVRFLGGAPAASQVIKAPPLDSGKEGS